MSDKKYLQITWLAAVCALAGGIVMTLGTIKDITESRAKIDRRLKEYAQLKELEAEAAGYDRAVEMFDKLGDPQAAPIKDLLKKKFTGANDNDIRETRRETVPGWIVRDVEAGLNDVVISDAMAFAGEMERGRPPWVLTKCVLTASSRVEGKGNAVLSFTGVSR